MSTALRPLLASSGSRLLFPPLPLRLAGSNGGGARAASISATAEARRARMAKPVPDPTGKKDRRRLDLEHKLPGPPPSNHGERFWIHAHISSNMTLYSLTPEMRANKTFRTQAVFTGKKLAPAKLRKDYWRTLAVVEFGEGHGNAGLSAFQKLRELKQRHLLEWGAQAEELLKMDRRARGEALNDQRGNTVADLAAVLAGAGKGNLLVEGTAKELRWVKWVGKDGKAVGGELKMLKPKKKVDGETAVAVAEGAEADAAATTPAATAGEEAKPEKLKLLPATIYWANEQDRFYAREWSDNVTHVLGLPLKEARENVARDQEVEAKRLKRLQDEKDLQERRAAKEAKAAARAAAQRTKFRRAREEMRR